MGRRWQSFSLLKENNNSTCKAFNLVGVSFSYRDTNSLVLDDINMECQEGEWLFILGRNGSGKSTMLKFINALLEPKRGVCYVFGLDASIPENAAIIRSQVALVFQNPESQIVGATVEDDAAFALENQCLSSDDIERRITYGLTKTGLLKKRMSSVHSLSGGEKQRLTLAGAIAQGARMFLLDEATSMLDSNGRDEILSLFMELHSEGHTIVQVTHNIEEVRFADRVIIIDEGRLVWLGGRKEFFDQAELLGFDLPTCAKFAKEIGVEDITDVDEIKRMALNAPSSDENIMRIKNLFNTAVPKFGRPYMEIMPSSEGYAFTESNAISSARSEYSKIETRSLTHIYSDGASDKIALENVSFCAKAGELTSIVGKTGSGKSTLIQYLNAIYTVENADNGEVLLDEQNINIFPREARRKIGMVFQFPEHQLFAQTVRDELKFALNNWGIPSDEHEGCIREACKQVGIPISMLDRSPFLLSGGEMKAVCIASALVTKPRWLILDEPVAGLDSRSKRELSLLLNELKLAGTGILTVTHDLEFALLNSDRIIVLNEGKLVCEGIPEATARFLHESRVLKLPDIVNLWIQFRGTS